MIPPGAPIVTAEAMRAAERRAFAEGMSQDAAMEAAGAAVAREAARFAMGRPILALAGPGNNGGDAFVAARLLADMGHDVDVATLGQPKPGSAATMAERWRGRVCSLYEARPRPVLVDGLFGTGLSRPLDRGPRAVLADLAANAECALAIDLPSGLDTDSGALLGAARMTATVALGALKPAHVLGAGLERCGQVLLADIGIPVSSAMRSVARPHLAAPAVDAHKYSRGMVAVIECAMPGAARLAARAAMAGAAGYVVLASAGDGHDGPDALVHRPIGPTEALADLLSDDRIGALVVGPGLGRERRAEAILKAAMAGDRQLVLDGDALTLLGRSAARWVRERSAPTFLTPHGGEFERMYEDDAGSKIDRTRALAAESGATVIHKGADTVIASPSGAVRVLGGASSWLSTAGTGDVLAGLVAAQVASGLAGIDAAEAAVWLHARAAQLAGPAFIADALIGQVPQAIDECL